MGFSNTPDLEPNIKEGEDLSTLYGIANLTSTVSIICALVANSKGKKRYRKATAAYNSVQQKTGWKPTIIITPNQIGIAVKF